MRDLNLDSEAKSRKALVSVSVATLALSNLELASNELEFLGLRVVVSLDKIVAALHLIIWLLLCAQLIYLIEKTPRSIARILRHRDERWWERWQPQIAEFHRQADPQAQFEHEQQEFWASNPDWDDEVYLEKSNREARRHHVLGMYRPIATTSRAITRYVFPISLGLVSVFAPEVALVLH